PRRPGGAPAEQYLAAGACDHRRRGASSARRRRQRPQAADHVEAFAPPAPDRPPTCDAERAARRLKELFETDPPYGAHVTYLAETPGNGWDAPETSQRLTESVDRARRAHFGKPAMHEGIGGSIPFMSILGERFPQSQFLITGVMGPGSNAHGPNEFLDLPTGVKVTAFVAQVVAGHPPAAP